MVAFVSKTRNGVDCSSLRSSGVRVSVAKSRGRPTRFSDVRRRSADRLRLRDVHWLPPVGAAVVSLALVVGSLLEVEKRKIR